MHRYWPTVTILFLCVLLSACSHPTSSSSSSPKAPTGGTQIATVVVHHDHLTPHEQLAGIIAPFQNVAIQSTLTEPTDAVNVQEGDTVHQGEVIAQLNTADLNATLQSDLATITGNSASTTHTEYQGQLSISQGVQALHTAQTAVGQARANLARDNADLTRYQELYKNGYVSNQQLTLTSTTVRNDEEALRSAEAGVVSAQANVTANGGLGSSGLQASAVEQARAAVIQAQAQANQTRVQISKATITSPIDGIVVNRNLNPGEYPGTRQIFTLQQIDPIYAVLHGSGEQVAWIKTGALATVHVADLRNLQLTGNVVGILNQLTPGSTDFEVKVQLSNPGARVRPGMVIVAIIPLPALSGTKVPLSSFADAAHDSVLAVASDGTVHSVHVVDLGESEQSAIVSGLAPESRILSNGQTQLDAGQKVAVQ
jgi:multidrug efflux pump subunit AcrA (membrane-fusion protein)